MGGAWRESAPQTPRARVSALWPLWRGGEKGAVKSGCHRLALNRLLGDRVDDLAGHLLHLLTNSPQDFHRSRTTSSVGDVAEGIVRGVEAKVVQGDEGDALGLQFAAPGLHGVNIRK